MKLSKKIILISFPLFVIFLFITGCNIKPYEEVEDGLLFKADYENYNNTMYELNIPLENEIKYLTMENVDLALSDISLIYFGYPTCDSCRVLVKEILDYNTYKIPIYYMDLNSERATYEINNRKIEKTSNGSDLYVKLVNYFSKYLDNYEMVVDDISYKTIDKYIKSPTLVFIKDGKICVFLDDFSCNEDKVCENNDAMVIEKINEAFGNYLN